MSLQTEIERIKTAKSNMITALRGKGVTVPAGETIDNFPSHILSIQTPVLQSKIVSPTTATQTVKPDSGYNGFSQVTVTAMPTATRASTTLKSTTSNNTLVLTASNPQTTGYVTADTNKDTATKTVSLSVSGATVTASDGSNEISKSVSTVGRASTSITTTADDTNDKLTITASNNQGTGYVTGSDQTASKVITLTASGATVTATDNSSTPVKISKSVATVSRAGTSITTTADDTNDKLTLSASNNQGTGYVEGSNQTASKVVTLSLGVPSINSSGLITATATATDNSTTPVKVSKSATNQLLVQGTTYITPTTTDRIAVESGRYTTGKVTVYGDSNLKAENIKKGISIFGVSGSYEGAGGSSDPNAVPATCTLLFVMDDYSPVAIACTQMTSSGINAFYQRLAQYSTVTVPNVVCGSTLLMQDTGGDGLWFSGSGDQCVQTGSLSTDGRIYRTPATSGTYNFYFDRS